MYVTVSAFHRSTGTEAGITRICDLHHEGESSVFRTSRRAWDREDEGRERAISKSVHLRRTEKAFNAISPLPRLSPWQDFEV
jgi:hypothetical protein